MNYWKKFVSYTTAISWIRTLEIRTTKVETELEIESG
jgi:hypothetical protein